MLQRNGKKRCLQSQRDPRYGFWDTLPPELLDIIQSYTRPVSFKLIGPRVEAPKGVVYATTVHDGAWSIFISRRTEHGQYYHVIEAFPSDGFQRQTLMLFQGCPERVVTLGPPGHVLLFRRNGHSQIWNLHTGATHIFFQPYLDAISMGHVLLSNTQSNLDVWRITPDLKSVLTIPCTTSSCEIDAIGSIPCRNQYAVLCKDRTVYVYPCKETVQCQPVSRFRIPDEMDISRVFPVIRYLGSGILALLTSASYRHPSQVLVLSVFDKTPWGKTLSLRRACDRLHPVSDSQFIVRSLNGIHSFALAQASDPSKCRLKHLQHISSGGETLELGHDGVTVSIDQCVYTLANWI